MKVKKYVDKTLLLKQGSWYDLEIVRVIEIPAGQPYFLTSDVNGLKHLIPSSHYIKYGLMEGDTIKCRLDRINCLGRFFFEPRHPYYNVNEIYRFDLVCFRRHSDDNMVQYSAIVLDIFKNEWETLKFTSECEPGQGIASILCRVVSIKKAKPVLMVTDYSI